MNVRTLALLALAASVVSAEDLAVSAGKSHVIDSGLDVTRVAVADPQVAEAVVISAREVLINGKAPGDTSLILWDAEGRKSYGIRVSPSDARLTAVRQEMRNEFGEGSVTATVEADSVFLRGNVRNLIAANRAVSIAASLGKVVNLLSVDVPEGDKQILLKVKFANLDRVAISELGANIFSTGAANTPGSISTQQFSPPQPKAIGRDSSFTISDALNIFLFRPDLNLGATIRALQSKRALEVLAEPNVLAVDGRPASFLAGGEFPYPVVQGAGTGLLTVTILFREFGIRLKFLPRVTPRGTIRLQVTPEVSSLDYANGLTYQGFHIPGLVVRRVETEIELAPGQSFAIAGLMDNRLTESMTKVPGLGDVPVLGRLFRSRALSREKTELLVMVTPEIVRPLDPGDTKPQVRMPHEFLKDGATEVPGVSESTRDSLPARRTIPAEELKLMMERAATAANTALPSMSATGSK